MSETKVIGKISVVTDSEHYYDNIGDVDGGFDEYELKKHIKAHGHEQLCIKLTSMNWQVWDMVRKINSEKERQTVNSI